MRVQQLIFSMKKTLQALLSLLLVCALLAGCFGGPQETPPTSGSTTEAPLTEAQDYVAQLQLNMSSETCKQQVTVKTYVDGDTTHFYVPESISETGVLKARFLAVDTPESTGKIEEYGKAASRFTREKLSGAQSIIIESDDAGWNTDSTGGRYLVWVWYRSSENEPYRNLNIELLQNGLALASSTANNRYGSMGMAALNQARSQKLNIYSGEPDPDYFYGDAIELTLRELRCGISGYEGKKVAFNGVVTRNSGNGVYVEAPDPETGIYSGISVYYGFNLSGDGLDILSVGTEVRIVGTVSYYEPGDTYQVSGLTCRPMHPEDPDNLRLLSEGNAPAFLQTDPATFAEGQVTVEYAGEPVTLPYPQLAMHTTISMDGLKVLSAYTTDNPDSSSYGAITLHCEADGYEITVRTAVLRDENNAVITQDAYAGKTLSVTGIVDSFQGQYQIKVLTAGDITIME